MDTMRSLNIEIPQGDIAFFNKLAKNMGWNITHNKVINEIDESLDDIRHGRVYHAANTKDLEKQIFG